MTTNHNGDETTRDEITREETAAANVTSYALNQLQGEERAEFELALAANSDGTSEQNIREIQALAFAISSARAAEPPTQASSTLRKLVEQNLVEPAAKVAAPKKVESADRRKRWRPSAVEWLVVGGMLAVFVALLLPAGGLPRIMLSSAPSSDDDFEYSVAAKSRAAVGRLEHKEYADQQNGQSPPPDAVVPPNVGVSGATNHGANQSSTELPFFESRLAAEAGSAESKPSIPRNYNPIFDDAPAPPREVPPHLRQLARNDRLQRGGASAEGGYGGGGMMPGGSMGMSGGLPAGPPQGTDERGRTTSVYGGKISTPRVLNRNDKLPADNLQRRGELELKAGQTQAANDAEVARLAKETADFDQRLANSLNSESKSLMRGGEGTNGIIGFSAKNINIGPGTEQYDPIHENPFLSPREQPLSTFSIDVDTASYANMRRFLTSGRLPPRNSVRIEELVNYFRYDYKQPRANEPFSANMEVTECPWREGHLLLRVGLKGKEVERSERPQSNLVFLLDVSGSMSDENKLPLLKTAMKLLAGELGESDRVTIVTYAGDAGLKLRPTRGHEQERIVRAIDSLTAGGSTNGSAGIELAYEQAAAQFVRGGTNRVILCTDGDLNVGVTSDDALVRLIKQKAASGVFLTVLGFGEGNLKDAKMEKLADNGNGLYAYIDSVREARKVLVEQLTGSTITIAKDVKIQIEFNPAQIAAYRLLGYENRVLAAEDFNNDKKDAGEIGAGHTVTALYELVPADAVEKAEPRQPGVDPLRYQEAGAGSRESGVGSRESAKLTEPAKSGELLTLKLRYKEPEGETSKLLEFPLKGRGHSFNSASPDLQFAAAVASFGMVLRQSQHRGTSNLAAIAEIASSSLGNDRGGYRAEFVDLVRKAQSLGAR